MLLPSKCIQTALKPSAGCQESQLQFLASAHSSAAGLPIPLCSKEEETWSCLADGESQVQLIMII